MTAETSIKLISESEVASKEQMPDGLYRYVRTGQSFYFDRNDEVEHKDIVGMNSISFSLQHHDAGFISLRWFKNPEEIDDLVLRTIEAHSKIGVEIDEKEFRDQINKNFSQTRVEILDKGSGTLMYVPNQQNRKVTQDMLQKLFPGALITLS